MQQPIEETLILQDDFSEFITTFPGIYRKISQRLNSGARLENSSTLLDATLKPIYNHTFGETSSFLYFIVGESASAPMTFGIGAFFANKTGIVLPVSNYTPGGSRLDVRVVGDEIQASVTPGTGSFLIKLLFL